MKDTTDEFSFLLKPGVHGVGVFAAHAIAKGAFLRLFGEESVEQQNYHFRPKASVPESFRDYCGDRGEMLACPFDFSAMPVGWYLNHSSKPNAGHRNFIYFAVRDIQEGEEITVDYNTLEEPEEAKDDYYRS